MWGGIHSNLCVPSAWVTLFPSETTSVIYLLLVYIPQPEFKFYTSKRSCPSSSLTGSLVPNPVSGTQHMVDWWLLNELTMDVWIDGLINGWKQVWDILRHSIPWFWPLFTQDKSMGVGGGRVWLCSLTMMINPVMIPQYPGKSIFHWPHQETAIY